MKLNTILRQYQSALKAKYAHRLLPSMYRAHMHCCVAEPRRLDHLNSSAPSVIREQVNRVLVAIAVVFNVKTMKPHAGWIASSQNCYRSSILW